NIQSGQTKYFKCEAIFGEAYKAHSIGSITKRGPSITISKDLNSITGFTPSSANPILSIGAAIINDGSNSRPLSYQWQSSSSENGPFTDISGATNSSYTVEIPDKTNWADKWFKCKVTSNTDTISAVYSRTTCVKMQLTNAQAKAELINWFNVDANATKVLKQFFNTRTESDVQNRVGGGEFFRYLYDHEFNSEEKLWFPKTEFYSATSKTVTVGDAKPFKSYTIVLKTISDGQYRTKKQGSTAAGSWNNLVTGAYIQFDLLFSFTGNAELVSNNNDKKFTVNFSPNFRFIAGKNVTSLAFDYTGNNEKVKKGAYTVKVYAHDGNANTPLFTDSLLDCVNFSGVSSEVYKDIPTYNGVTGRK
ncbi:MAG: hypothetical protein RSC65_02560, partial [Malacoplasma sp.]